METNVLSGAPTDDQKAEFDRLVKLGKITKQNFQYYLQDPDKSGVPGSVVNKLNFFGVDEWKFHFGDKATPRRIPPMPWSWKTINDPANKDKFFFLCLDRLNGHRLTVNSWPKILEGRKHHPFFAKAGMSIQPDLGCNLKWECCCLSAIIPELNTPRTEHSKKFLPQYRVPSLADRLTANILYCLLNNEYFDHGMVYTGDDKGRCITYMRTEWLDDETIAAGISFSFVSEDQHFWTQSLALNQLLF